MAPRETSKATKSSIRKGKKKASKKDDEQEQEQEQEGCPICLDENPVSKSAFPCGHTTCSKCFIDPRLKACPLCRTTRDGTSGQTQRERRERDQGRSQQEIRVFTFVGGSGHPFDVSTMTVTTGPFGASLAEALRSSVVSSIDSTRRLGARPSNDASGARLQEDLERLFRRII